MYLYLIIVNWDDFFYEMVYINYIKVLYFCLNWSSKCFLGCCVKIRVRIVFFLVYVCECCRVVNIFVVKYYMVIFIFFCDVFFYGKY